jgi:hypothetical protein
MTTALEYRKKQYAPICTNIIKNLTKDNFNTYLLDILNILCIPHNMICYRTNNSNYNDTAQFINGDLQIHMHFIFKQVEFKKCFWSGYKYYYQDIDISNLKILYNIAKLLCTIKSTYAYLTPIKNYDKVIRYLFDLNPNDNIGNTSIIDRFYRSITVLFKFDDSTLAIDVINYTIHNICHSSDPIKLYSSRSVYYTPVAAEVEKSDSNTSTPSAPLAPLWSPSTACPPEGGTPCLAEAEVVA